MTHPYLSKQYVSALANGNPIIQLGDADQYALLRPIPDQPYTDISGPYPFGLADDHALENVVMSGKRRPVSYVGITDALSNQCVPTGRFDVLRPYKTHYIIDRHTAPVLFSKHHRHEIKKANKFCTVKRIELAQYLDEWCALYDSLIAKHALSKHHRFSRTYFQSLAATPCFITFGAYVGETLVSAHIWLQYNDNMHSHLAASSPLGYEYGASYSLYSYVIERFSDCNQLDLGGVPDNSLNDGLARFKQGFSNTTKTNWICGQILDQKIYHALCQTHQQTKKPQPQHHGYFPAYRKPG